MAFERVRLPCMVRRVRTTDGKRTSSNLVTCAFAPPEEMVRRGISGRNVALNTTSSSVVQRHTPWHWNACICRLWCEGFAPQTASARLPIPSFLPLHHKETLRYGMLSCVPEKDENRPAQRILYESINNDRHGSISIDTDIEP